MRRSIACSIALLGTTLAAAPLHARQRGPTVGITPQAGYMFFGHHLEGPIGTTLSSASGPLYGVQLGLDLLPILGLYGSAGYARSDLRVGVPFLGGFAVGTSDAVLVDGGLEARLPETAGSRVNPFVQAGVGIMRYRIRNDILDVDATNAAFNAGLGADIRLAPGLALRVMGKDYIGQFDFAEATLLPIEGSTSHNFALTAGIRIGF